VSRDRWAPVSDGLDLGREPEIESLLVAAVGELWPTVAAEMMLGSECRLVFVTSEVPPRYEMVVFDRLDPRVSTVAVAVVESLELLRGGAPDVASAVRLGADVRVIWVDRSVRLPYRLEVSGRVVARFAGRFAEQSTTDGWEIGPRRFVVHAAELVDGGRP